MPGAPLSGVGPPIVLGPQFLSKDGTLPGKASARPAQGHKEDADAGLEGSWLSFCPAHVGLSELGRMLSFSIPRETERSGWIDLSQS